MSEVDRRQQAYAEQERLAASLTNWMIVAARLNDSTDLVLELFDGREITIGHHPEGGVLLYVSGGIMRGHP